MKFFEQILGLILKMNPFMRPLIPDTTGETFEASFGNLQSDESLFIRIQGETDALIFQTPDNKMRELQVFLPGGVKDSRQGRSAVKWPFGPVQNTCRNIKKGRFDEIRPFYEC